VRPRLVNLTFASPYQKSSAKQTETKKKSLKDSVALLTDCEYKKSLRFRAALSADNRLLQKTIQRFLVLPPTTMSTTTSGLTRRRGGGGGGGGAGGGGDGDGESSNGVNRSNSTNNARDSAPETSYESGENGHRIAFDPRDISESAERSKQPKLTLMEEVLLLGLKDKQVRPRLPSSPVPFSAGDRSGNGLTMRFCGGNRDTSPSGTTTSHTPCAAASF